MLLTSSKRVIAAVVVLVTTATVGVVLLWVLALTVVPSSEGQRVVDLVAAALIVRAAIDLVLSSQPDRVIDALEGVDSVALYRAGMDARSLMTARLWMPRQAWVTSVAFATPLTAWIGQELVPGVGADVTVLACAALVWAVGANLSLGLSVLSFTGAVRLPPRWVGPAVFGSGVVVTVVEAVALVWLLSWLRGLGLSDDGDLGAVIAKVSDQLHSGPWSLGLEQFSWLLVLAAVTAVLALGVIKRLAPAQTPLLLQKLQGGHRWRINHPFSGGLGRITADKDVRLLLRRGVPAWRTLEETLDLMPFALGASFVGAGMMDLSGQRSTQTIVEITLLCVLVAIVGMSSEALTPVLSTDSDGATLRLFRWRAEAFPDYLASKVRVATTLFLVVGLFAGTAVHFIAPWDWRVLPAVLVTLALAAVAEALCLVLGSAYRPALFRKSLGVAEIEPAVKVASGIAAAVVIAVATPLVALSALVPEGPALVSLLVATGLLVGSPWIAGRAAPALYTNLTKGGAVNHGYGLGGSAGA